MILYCVQWSACGGMENYRLYVGQVSKFVIWPNSSALRLSFSDVVGYAVIT